MKEVRSQGALDDDYESGFFFPFFLFAALLFFPFTI